MKVRKEDIFEKVFETFDPITGEKNEILQKYVFVEDKQTGEKVEKKIISMQESRDEDCLTVEVLLEDNNYNNCKKDVVEIENDAKNNTSIDILKNNVNRKKRIMLVCSIILFMITTIFVVVKIFLEDPHVKVSQALHNTFKKSREHIEEIFYLNSLKDMLQNGTYTFETKFSNKLDKPIVDIKVVSKQNVKKSFTIDLFDNETLELFLNDEDVYIKASVFGDRFYKINYDKLNQKFDEFLESIDANQKDVEYFKALKYYASTKTEFEKKRKEVFNKIVIKSLKVLYDTDLQKIEPLVREINGKTETLKGYEFYIKGEDILEIIDIIVNEINNSEILKNRILLNKYFDEDLELNNISVEDMQKEIDEILKIFKKSISELKQDCEDIVIVFNAYLYDNYIANAKLDIYKDAISYEEIEKNIDEKMLQFSASFISNGGSYPLENMQFKLNKNGKKILAIETNGKDNDDIFELVVKLSNKFIPIGAKIFYDKNQKIIELNDFNDIVTFVRANILNDKNNSNIELSIEYPIIKIFGVKTYIIMNKKVEDIKKPEGEIIDTVELVDKKINILFSIFKNQIENFIL